MFGMQQHCVELVEVTRFLTFLTLTHRQHLLEKIGQRSGYRVAEVGYEQMIRAR
jgi:hypothetical protein